MLAKSPSLHSIYRNMILMCPDDHYNTESDKIINSVLTLYIFTIFHLHNVQALLLNNVEYLMVH